ncbi:EAL domain-containing protein, partial [Klebsiella pneumoniae]
IYLWRRWQNRQMSLAEEIEKGIARGEFSVHYQPVCETTSGMCTGAEALMRWQRRDGRTISPAVFICAAEENGTIIPLTRHLFELIIRDAKGWEVSAP